MWSRLFTAYSFWIRTGMDINTKVLISSVTEWMKCRAGFIYFWSSSCSRDHARFASHMLVFAKMTTQYKVCVPLSLNMLTFFTSTSWIGVDVAVLPEWSSGGCWLHVPSWQAYIGVRWVYLGRLWPLQGIHQSLADTCSINRNTRTRSHTALVLTSWSW